MTKATSHQRVASGLRLAIVVCASLIAVDPALAQLSVGPTSKKPLSDAQCLVRAVGLEGKKSGMAIIVPAAQATAMLKRGFAPVPCQSAFAAPKAATDWRDKVCNMASNPNEKVQDQLEKFLGERPNVLCGMAEQVVGQWQVSPQKAGSATNPGNGGL